MLFKQPDSCVTMPKLFRSMKTALHQAVLDQRLHQVRLLIKQRVNVNIQDLHGRTPLMVACFLDDETKAFKIVRTLIRAGSCLDIYDDFHRSALSYAALNGLLNVLSFLLQLDSCTDFNEVDNNGSTLLHMAAESGNPELVNFLLDDFEKYHHHKIDVENSEGFTPFLLACKNNNCASAYILLTKGKACIDVRDHKENMNAVEWINVSQKSIFPTLKSPVRNKTSSIVHNAPCLSREYTMYRRHITPICRHVGNNKPTTFAGSYRRMNNVHLKQKERYLEGFVDAREALLIEIAKINKERRPLSSESNSSSVHLDLVNQTCSTERTKTDLLLPQLFQLYSEQLLENNTQQLSALTLTSSHLKQSTTD
ncbi:neurogenic locus notch homolog protein 1 [Octopus bimaculoides]|uniref:Uncharacterized protein n=1 Tax=Octopus bimaculoides TaxID=37653 RepID=A0A0L8H6C0_OCTBM|nr:neurogenic locus notch homolog protein 1 [Octopus bimaculoides]|eukprot:XP_014775071.1 PREDICTED: neurogenic locus notch homolog protein 1-like [Octopus bimaculoides]